MKTTLYPEQQVCHDRAVESFDKHGHFGAYPFPIGNGKTITALTTTETLAHKGIIDALVVVCPRSVCATWEKQIDRHCDWPSKPFRWRGDKATTAKYKNAMMGSLVDPFPIFIVNIEALQTVNKLLFQTISDFIKRNKVMVILDEGSTIKNHKAKRTQNVTELMRPAVARIFLSGILFSNSILEIYSPYEWLKQAFWKERSPWFFEKRYCVHIQRYVQEGKTIEVIAGPKDVREMLAKVEMAEASARKTGREVPYYIKQMRYDAEDLQRKLDRSKELEKEVFAQIDHCTFWINTEDKLLPPVHVEMIVEMSDKEEQAYNDFKNDLMTVLDSGEVLSVTTKGALFQKARQIVGGFIDEQHPVDVSVPSKIQAIIDEVSTIEDSAIIVSNYRGAIKKATEELNKIAPTGSLFGDTKQEDRDAFVEQFGDGRLRFLVCNPAVMARGVDGLQGSCKLMFFIDVHPNPEVMDQVRGRIRRQGQTGVCVYKYATAVTQSGKDTVDRRCLNILEDKQDVIESFHSLSKQGLRNFF